MSEEIKEILDNLKFTNNDTMWCDKITLDVEQSHLLLDYITNLQQIEEKHRKLNGELRKEISELQNNRDKAIKYIENSILDNTINKVNWGYDDCVFSDMPAERIKPLIDILGDKND